MKLLRIKFVRRRADEPRAQWRLGVIGFYDRLPGLRFSGLAVSVSGLLGWMAVAAVATYLAGAGALYYLWQRNPYSVLTYGDAVLFPVRRPEIAAKQGRAYIAQGLELWNQRKLAEAANLLRQGLARYPGDLRARLRLAEFYGLVNRRLLAVEVLEQGLGDEFPSRAYMSALFEAAQAIENFELIADICRRYKTRLRREDVDRERPWLEQREFAALMSAERFDEALALAKAGTGDTANERRVLVLLAAKRTEEAVAFLAEWQARPGSSRELTTRLQVRAFREAERFDEMERAMGELRRLSPTSPAPAVYAIVQQALAGRSAEAAAEVDDFIFRFGGTPANLLMAADPLADIGNVELLKRLRAAAAERGHPLVSYDLWLVEAHVLHGEWAAAAAVLEQLPAPAGREAVSGQVWREWMRHLITAAQVSAGPAQTELVEFMRARLWPIRLFRRTIEALRRAERWETAQDIAAMAARMFPTSAWVRTQTEEIGRALEQRTTVPEETPVADRAGDLEEEQFFAAMNAALAEKRWEDAGELIERARDVRPALTWIARRDAELRLAQTRIGHERGSITQMLAAARLYLNGSNERSGRMLDLAREIYASDREHAIELAREVRRTTPDYPPVNRQLAEWQPRR